jgi:hypothetical protein
MAGRYNNRAYVSNAPGAFYGIAATDFGAPAPAAPSLTYHAGSGSLATTTATVEVTWITAEGVSAPSPTATVAVTAASGGVTVVQPTVPTGQQAVIGWQIYSTGTTTAALLNTSSTSTSPAPVSISTNAGFETGYLVSTTSVLLEVYGTGAAAPSVDGSGIQPALPLITAQHTVEYYAVIPNTGSQWKQQKSVQSMCSSGVPETAGITLNRLDFIQPVYPGAANEPQGGANPPSSTYTQASVAPGTWMVMNGYLFEAVQLASASTAANFIGYSAFNKSKGSTTTDGSVTWLSYGKAGLLRFDFGNLTSGSLTPAARSYDCFQL